MSKSEEFAEIVRTISKGGDVDQEELADALGYAGSAWYEIQQLTKSLCAGYRALQKDILRKDRKLEIANKMTTAVRAENERLRERIREMEQEIRNLKAGTGDPSPTEGGGGGEV